MPGTPRTYKLGAPSQIYVEVHLPVAEAPEISIMDLSDGWSVLRLGHLRLYFEGGRAHIEALCQQTIVQARRVAPEEEG